MSKIVKVNLDLLLVQRRMSLTELADRVGITLANLSILKRSKAKAIRFSTLIALCEALECTPGDLLALEESAAGEAGDADSDDAADADADDAADGSRAGED